MKHKPDRWGWETQIGNHETTAIQNKAKDKKDRLSDFQQGRDSLQ